MMDDDEIQRSIDDRMLNAGSQPARPITPIAAFSVDPPDDDLFVAMRVIGIRPRADDPDDFEFVVLKQTVEGEIFVSTANEVYGDLPAASLP